MNSNNSHIRGALKQAGRRIKLSAILVNASWWIAVCLAWWLAIFILDNLLSLPAGLRLPLALGGAALVGVGFVKKIFSALRVNQRPERTAVELEKRYGIKENALINACQFEQQSFRPEEASFARRTVDMGASSMGRIPFAELWDRKHLTTWGTAAAVLVVVWGGYIALYPHHVWNAGARFVIPLADRPPVASITLHVKPGADVAVVEGDNVEVTLEVTGGKVKDMPVLVWKEGAESVQPMKTKSSGEHLPMAAAQGAENKFTYLFSDVRHPFAFRVFADDTYSRSVAVGVKSLPRIKESVFRVTPPSYTGLGMNTNPGPPSSVSGLPGSKMEMALIFEPAVEKAFWKEAGKTVELQRNGKRWECVTAITNPGEYEIEVTDAAFKKNVTVARGAVRLDSDNPPEIDFVTDDRNRLVSIGNSVKLEISARDDFGIGLIDITARSVESDQSTTPSTMLKRWTYMGPPGNKGPLKETYLLEIDPTRFKPDAAYLVEAVARDFRPDGLPGRSRPIMLRVKGLNEFALSSGDEFAGAFAALRQTIAKQEKANSRTANLKTYLEEAVQKKTVPDRRKAMSDQQLDAQKSGQQTVVEFNKAKDGAIFSVRLVPLVEGEMTWVLKDIDRLSPKDTQDALGKRLGEIEKRQTYILTELVSLLGSIADRQQQSLKTNALAKEIDHAPLISNDDAMKDLKDDLKKFLSAQEKLIERTKSLLDKGPQDLTDKDEKILGEMAREEAKWAKFFEEKLTDWSKLPAQDFADSAIAKEVNEVFQEIKMAAKELYEKKMELAVPTEQGGLENAKELVQNLERWLPDTPDNIKWNMEEPNTPGDIAMAELPAELEDIVGDLIDKEDEMAQDIEDVTSPWMDSMDKGVGWGAGDGPISDMSAKGVTGNLSPNQMEIGGRSGEGRSGRSSGQMVEETAEGKGGRETPTRVSPSPFEQGSVKDKDTKSNGGATGGGKLSGHGEEGLRGPTPSQQTAQNLPRIADRQGKIRQEAEALALKLRGYHLPTGDLEVSINQMKTLEDAARKVDGATVRRSFSRAVDALSDAKKTMRAEVGLHTERVKLPQWMRNEIKSGFQDATPKGYEEMASEYFRVLAEQKTK